MPPMAIYYSKSAVEAEERASGLERRNKGLKARLPDAENGLHKVTENRDYVQSRLSMRINWAESHRTKRPMMSSTDAPGSCIAAW